MSTPLDLRNRKYFVHQIFETAELFGFETRNKYEILSENSQRIAYAAEQSKGLFGFLLRQFLGHWRSFEIHVFSPERTLLIVAKHPFRFYFNQVDIFDAANHFLGRIRRRFSLLSKRFDVENERGSVILEVSSPLWKIWTFPFRRHNEELATVRKKWSGLLNEAFTDKDRFQIEFHSHKLSNEERQLVLVSALFIDLIYFENKAGQ
jgi:uncharacterized protein YxjI